MNKVILPKTEASIFRGLVRDLIKAYPQETAFIGYGGYSQKQQVFLISHDRIIVLENPVTAYSLDADVTVEKFVDLEIKVLIQPPF